MKKFLVLIVSILFLSSCGVNKKMVTEKTHTWENRKVTKKEYDSLLYQHTYKFVQNYKAND